ARLSELAVWPPDPPNRLRRDGLFPDGYPAALEELLAGAVAPEEHLARLDPAARVRAAELLAVHPGVAAALVPSAADAPPVVAPGASLPRSVSATQVAGRLSERIT